MTLPRRGDGVPHLNLPLWHEVVEGLAWVLSGAVFAGNAGVCGCGYLSHYVVQGAVVGRVGRHTVRCQGVVSYLYPAVAVLFALLFFFFSFLAVTANLSWQTMTETI